MQQPGTNLGFVDISSLAQTASEFIGECEAADLRGMAIDDLTLRFAFHRDVTDGEVETAIETVEAVTRSA